MLIKNSILLLAAVAAVATVSASPVPEPARGRGSSSGGRGKGPSFSKALDKGKKLADIGQFGLDVVNTFSGNKRDLQRRAKGSKPSGTKFSSKNENHDIPPINPNAPLPRLPHENTNPPPHNPGYPPRRGSVGGKNENHDIPPINPNAPLPRLPHENTNPPPYNPSAPQKKTTTRRPSRKN